METRLRIRLLACAMLVTTACGADEPAQPPASSAPPIDTTSTASTVPGPPPVEAGFTIAEALRQPDGSTVRVDGFLVAAEGEEVRLAEALAESYPPQPGGASLIVAGLDPASVVGAITDMGVTWTDGAIQLAGTISAGVLTIEDG